MFEFLINIFTTIRFAIMNCYVNKNIPYAIEIKETICDEENRQSIQIYNTKIKTFVGMNFA